MVAKRQRSLKNVTNPFLFFLGWNRREVASLSLTLSVICRAYACADACLFVSSCLKELPGKRQYLLKHDFQNLKSLSKGCAENRLLVTDGDLDLDSDMTSSLVQSKFIALSCDKYIL